VDMMNLSMVIPLPGTDMWECLDIRQKLAVWMSCVPADHPEAPALERVRGEILEAYPDLAATRYDEQPEADFWKKVYRLSDAAQVLIMQSYDSFNADSAHEIDLKREDPEFLWNYREGVVGSFYSGLRMKLRMIAHVFHRSSNLQDIAAYLTLLGRKYDPEEKARAAATIAE